MRKLIFILSLFFLMSFTQKDSDIVIYPNPAKNYFFIECKNCYLLPYLKIYDIHGKLVQTEVIGEYVQSKRIDVNLESGIYFVYLTSMK